MVIKKFFKNIKDVVVWMWAKDPEHPQFDWIVRAILILAVLGLPLALLLVLVALKLLVFRG